MRQIRLCRNLAEAHLVKGVLDSAGIAASIRGEHLVDVGVASAATEMRPTVWVDDADLAAAADVLADHLTAAGDGAQALEDDDGAPDDGGQQVMGELFLAAGGLARDPRRGDLLDQVMGVSVPLAGMRPPYGVHAEAWARIASLTEGVVAAHLADDPDAVQVAAGDLRDVLRELV